MGSESMNKRSLKNQRSWIFALTFLTYAAIYSTRSSWSYCKKNIQSSLEIPNDFLGTIDMMFLMMYAISLNIVGNINTQYQKKNNDQKLPVIQSGNQIQNNNTNQVDENTPLHPLKKKSLINLKFNMNLKHLLLLGIIPASLIFTSLSLFYVYDIKNPWSLVLLMALNGIFQGPAWPSLVNIFGNWFQKGNRGLMMGIWACNSNFGQIFGLQIGHMAIVQYEWGWQVCVLITGGFLLFVGILNLVFLQPYPEEFGLNLNEPENNKLKQQIQQEELQTQDSLNDSIQIDIDETSKLNENSNYIQQKTLSYAETFKIPSVLVYTISYSALKSTVYGLLFWLPKYLDENGLQQYSASIAQSMQVGTVVGGVLTGCLSDYIGKRSVVLSPLLFIASIMMFIIKFYLTSENIISYYLTIFVIGVCLGGPYTLISSTISLDLSEQPQVKGNKSALISITSVIEGSGAFTAALLQRIIPIVGQKNIFFLFFSLCLVATCLLCKIAKNEIKELKIAKQYLKNIGNSINSQRDNQKQIQMVQISQQPLKKLKD